MSKLGQLMADEEEYEEYGGINNPEPDLSEEPRLTAVDNAVMDVEKALNTLDKDHSELHKYANELRTYAKRLVSLAGVANQRPF